MFTSEKAMLPLTTTLLPLTTACQRTMSPLLKAEAGMRA